LLSPNNCKVIFIVLSLTCILVLVSPILSPFIPRRSRESFSEIYLLGSNRMAENYPFKVKPGEVYSIFLGLGNHMGASAYYAIYLKIRDRSEDPPDPRNNMPSLLPIICDYHVFLSDGEVWEKSLNFSLSFNFSDGGCCLLKELIVNDERYAINKLVLWDSEKNGFFINIFFELWIYDSKIRGFSFHNRFVGIWLNVTNTV